MERIRPTIKIDEVMEQDELEARQSAAQSNKKRLMRRKKRAKMAKNKTRI